MSGKGLVMTSILTNNESLTINARDRLDEQFDKVEAQNYLLVDMAPPRESSSFHPLPLSVLNAESYSLDVAARNKEIPGEVHTALLEQSLKEYADLWRSLAQK